MYNFTILLLFQNLVQEVPVTEQQDLCRKVERLETEVRELAANLQRQITFLANRIDLLTKKPQELKLNFSKHVHYKFN